MEERLTAALRTHREADEEEAAEMQRQEQRKLLRFVYTTLIIKAMR